jgi:hypothetical protein
MTRRGVSCFLIRVTESRTALQVGVGFGKGGQ